MKQKSNRRNFLLVTSLLTICIAAFLLPSCNRGTKPAPDNTDTTKCGPCMAYNNVKPGKNQLELNLLKTMAFNYQNPIPTNQTRSIWFSLETLKDFIHQIESKSCDTCTGNLGIRFYFAKYPSPTGPTASYSDLSTLDPGYAGIQTLFMVPTIDNLNGYHFDFDPAVNCNPYKLNRIMDSIGVFPPGGGTVTALMAQNHGDACPPPPTPTTTCPAIGAFFNK
jgi:hypothetical protein